MRHFLGALLALLILYLALTANLEPGNLVTGAILAGGVAWLLRLHGRPFKARRPATAAWALLRFLVFLAIETIQSTIAVARIILSPALPIRPGIVAIPSGTPSELVTALSAHAISLAPGEMVVEIDPGGVMYTHCLDAGQVQARRMAGQQRRRELLEQILG